jgi:hypothetical protein
LWFGGRRRQPGRPLLVWRWRLGSPRRRLGAMGGASFDWYLWEMVEDCRPMGFGRLIASKSHLLCHLLPYPLNHPYSPPSNLSLTTLLTHSLLRHDQLFRL